MRKLVGNHQLVIQQSNHTLLNANLSPTLQANYRQLGLVSLLSRDIDSISAALNFQITLVDFQLQPHILPIFGIIIIKRII